jgi:hypothetical protein
MIRFWTVFIPLVFIIGCGSSKTYPINGTVVFTGETIAAKELAGHNITIEPEAPNAEGKKHSGSGLIDADGKFKISTFELNDGAVSGKHKVAITPPVQSGDGPAAKPLIPSRYGDLGTSGLIITVEAGKPDVKIEVSKK